MTKSFGETLYEIYLSSIQDVVEYEDSPAGETSPEYGSGESRLEVIDRDKDQIPFRKVVGTVRELAWKGSLICYVIIDELPQDHYQVIKASPFIQFAFGKDQLITGHLGQYIAELENSFQLSASEIERSVVLDSIDTLSLMEIQQALDDEAETGKAWLKNDGGGDLYSWKQKFRMRELELTVWFRSRNAAGSFKLLIPQLEWVDEAALVASLHFAADTHCLYEAFSLMRQRDSRQIFHTLSHTLQRESNGWIALYPDPELCTKRGKIFCGALCVFDGYLPARVILDYRAEGLDLEAFQSCLGIRIELVDEEA